MTHPKLKKSNRLPQFWYVEHEDSENFKKIINFLNSLGGSWSGHGHNYYGYDNSKGSGGTEAHHSSKFFENNAVLLTVNEAIKLMETEEIINQYSIY